MSDPNRQRFGRSAEAAAAEYLQRLGYVILERNYRTAMGEIDIIAMHESVLVFVEVKARRTDRFGGAKAAVTPQKQRKISMAALAYLKRERKMGHKARFDVVAIRADESHPQAEIIRNAFELAYP
ncbi:MAG: YraN family protein [Desulfobacteraceae bacterium]|nr:YraN family protein [Desulfobacteraceae bacterium]